MPGNLYLPCLSAGLHLSGADGATSFPDLKGHSFYRTGAVAISTAQSRFAGEGSAYFPGGVDDLIKCDQHADFGDSGASMAISFSMFPTRLPPSGQEIRLIMVGANDSYGTFFVGLTSSGGVCFGIAAGGTNATGNWSNAFVLNQWNDVLFTMFDGRAMISVNRVLVAWQDGQYVPSAGIPKRVQIGGDNSGDSSVDHRFQGYLADLEIQLRHGRQPPAMPPTVPFADTLGIGIADARHGPIAALRVARPDIRILPSALSTLALDVEHGGRGRVAGTTKNVGAPDYPVSRRVRLLRKRDGLLARECWSDAGGNYLFDKVRHDREYVVMAHDHTGLYNAVVADTVTPELIT
mgnify:CR=1 FL=1